LSGFKEFTGVRLFIAVINDFTLRQNFKDPSQSCSWGCWSFNDSIVSCPKKL